jgi:predicted transporter
VIAFFGSIVVSIREAIQKDLNSTNPAILVTILLILLVINSAVVSQKKWYVKSKKR